MEKFTRIIKQTFVFLAIFLVINMIFQSCQDPQDQIALNSGNVLFTTTDTEYSRRQTVTVKIRNGMDQPLIIANECPNEPFVVERLENNEWVTKEATPEGLDCSDLVDLEIAPNEEARVDYKNWNFALFGETGTFRISYTAELDGEAKTFTTNNFIITQEGLFRQLWLGLFYKPIYNALIFITQTLPGHPLGWAIIILTLIIRTILLIPSQKAMQSQRRMQEIQPRLEKIKEKYKNDQQRLAAETMAVWKEAKVNPMGSCLPLLLQFPFLIAIFYVIQDGLNPDTTNLLYTTYTNFSITDIDTHFLGLNLLKINAYVLPVIIGSLQFAQMKLAMARTNKKKKGKDKDGKKNEMQVASNMMIYIMPVMIAVFTASLPAGVGIYWGTSTIYGIVQQFFVNKGSKSSISSSSDSTVRVIKVDDDKK